MAERYVPVGSVRSFGLGEGRVTAAVPLKVSEGNVTGDRKDAPMLVASKLRKHVVLVVAAVAALLVLALGASGGLETESVSTVGMGGSPVTDSGGSPVTDSGGEADAHSSDAPLLASCHHEFRCYER